MWIMFLLIVYKRQFNRKGGNGHAITKHDPTNKPVEPYIVTRRKMYPVTFYVAV